MAPTSTTPAKPRRFRLDIVGPIEDQPRLIRAYGKACGGEAALVLRPTEGRGVLVLVGKEGAWKWEVGLPPQDGLEHATARLERGEQDRFEITSGPHQGTRFLSYEPVPRALRDGQPVTVAFAPADQFARLTSSGASDSPLRPSSEITAAEAVRLIKDLQKGPPKAGPTTLRGRWSGVLICDNGQPRVELKRKLATYGTLWVTSTQEQGWAWRFERGENWFSDEGESQGQGLATLSAAIEAGVLGAMRLVREACSFRDTRRRAAHDPDWAQRHPIKPPSPTTNPTERFEGKAAQPRKRRKKAPPPSPLDTPVELPDQPATQAALQRMASEVEAEGDALASLRGVTWLWEEPRPVGDIADFFDKRDLPGMAEAIRSYRAGPDQPQDSFLDELRGMLTDELADRGIPNQGDVARDARLELDELRAALQSTPVQMERARHLVQYATRMVQSPLCRGREQREAVESIQRAAQAYEEARTAVLEGRAWDAQRTLRRIGERVALGAAKAARSCALGQTSLTALADEKKDQEPARPSRRRGSKRATSKPARQGARRAAASEERQAPTCGICAAEPVAAPPEADAVKDKALMDAFSQAIAAALGGEAA